MMMVAEKATDRNETPARLLMARIILAMVFFVLACQPTVAAQGTTPDSGAGFPGTQSGAEIGVPECRIRLVHEVSLACERSGVLDFVTPVGQHVQGGEVIARIRDSVAQAAYSIAERESANDIEIQFARKAGELAQLKYERAQQADRALPGTVTDFELRELRLAAERSLLQLQQAEHQFEIAQLRKQEQQEQLNSYRILAPFDAHVRLTSKKEGEYVREGEIVLEIVNDNIMQVEGFVDLVDLPLIAIGNEVTIRLEQSNAGDISFRGWINFVDPKIEPISMKARISAQVQNSGSVLKDGFLVTMAIKTNPPVAAVQSVTRK